MKLLKSRARA